MNDVELTAIWPLKNLYSYGSWGETINGNSIIFRLKYKDYEMLSTGDHNEKPEEELLKHAQQEMLNCDVLKTPHHGNKHTLEEFVRPDKTQPVVTVASMGSYGFSTNWKLPSTDVVKWAGGAHRFYSTYIHERRFRWEDMQDVNKRSERI